MKKLDFKHTFGMLFSREYDHYVEDMGCLCDHMSGIFFSGGLYIMEKSTVYFTDFRCKVGTSQLDKLRKQIGRASCRERVLRLV